jgi:hypothetical protein
MQSNQHRNVEKKLFGTFLREVPIRCRILGAFRRTVKADCRVSEELERPLEEDSRELIDSRADEARSGGSGGPRLFGSY